MELRKIVLLSGLVALLGVACGKNEDISLVVKNNNVNEYSNLSRMNPISSEQETADSYVLSNGMKIPKNRSLLENRGSERIFQIDIGIKDYSLVVHDNGIRPYWEADQGVMTVNEDGTLDESKLTKVPNYNLAKGYCRKGHAISLWDIRDESDPCYSEKKR